MGLSDYLKNIGWHTIANMCGMSVENTKIQIPRVSQRLLTGECCKDDLSRNIANAVEFYNDSKDFLSD